MEVIVHKSAAEASAVAGRLVGRNVRENPPTVLGLATGSTPVALYQSLVRQHRDDDLDFSQVRTFNLDEYAGLKRDHEQSY
ncbi:MAG: glucosamine-6-phosphate deaminase, partial [Verrucomicrobiia bacterium]